MRKAIVLVISILMILSIGSTSLAESIFTKPLAECTDEELDQAMEMISTEKKARLKTTIAFDTDNISVKKGGSQKINASVIDLTEGITAGKKFTWESSAPEIATCNNGTVKGIANGTTTITCKNTLSDGTELSADISVTVFTMVNGITVAEKEIKVMATEKIVPTVAFKPEDATYTELIYKSADENIAAVIDGVLTAISPGKTVITAETTDGSNKTAKFTVTVTRLIGSFSGEVTFQDMQWGIDKQTAIDRLTASGFLKEGVTTSPSYTSRYWPEDEMEFGASFSGPEVPQIIKDKKTGAFYIRRTPIKKVGGREPADMDLNFVNGIKNGEIDEDESHLIAVQVNYNTEHEKGIDIFVDLLGKLQEQYGEFRLYIDNSISEWAKYDAETNEMYLALQSCSDEITEADLNQTYAFAVMHGENNTGIVLRLDSWSWTRLIYGKTDSYKQIQEIQEILEAIPDTTEEAGL